MLTLSTEYVLTFEHFLRPRSNTPRLPEGQTLKTQLYADVFQRHVVYVLEQNIVQGIASVQLVRSIMQHIASTYVRTYVCTYVNIARLPCTSCPKLPEQPGSVLWDLKEQRATRKAPGLIIMMIAALPSP